MVEEQEEMDYSIKVSEFTLIHRRDITRHERSMLVTYTNGVNEMLLDTKYSVKTNKLTITWKGDIDNDKLSRMTTEVRSILGL